MDVNFPHEAVEAINEILKVGSDKGYAPGSWRNEPAFHHLGKAIGHLGRYLAWIAWPLKPMVEDHLAHGLCRLAMCVAVMRKGGHNA